MCAELLGQPNMKSQQLAQTTKHQIRSFFERFVFWFAGSALALAAACYILLKFISFHIPKVTLGDHLTISNCSEQGHACMHGQIHFSSPGYELFRNWLSDNKENWKLELNTRKTHLSITSEDFMIFITGMDGDIVFIGYKPPGIQYSKKATSRDWELFLALAASAEK